MGFGPAQGVVASSVVPEAIPLIDLSDVAAVTGTGTTVVLQTSPILVTPVLGTPASGTLTNCTGLPIATGVANLAANMSAFLASGTSATLAAALSDETGSGALNFGSSSVDPATANCRLDYTNTTTLTLTPTGGNKIAITGVLETVSSQTMVSGTTLISASGANLGTVMAASTLYYTYFSGVSASYAPQTLHPSATVPSLVNGVYYLGSSGNALNWRYVGWVKPTAALVFANSDTQRLVKSYYNRRPARMFLCLGYNNNDTLGSVSLNSNPWAVHSSVASPHFEFIADGDETVEVDCVIHWSNDAQDSYVSVALDSTTDALNAGYLVMSTKGVTESHNRLVPSAGYHYLNLMYRTTGARTAYIDFARNGSVADTPASYISANVTI